ncbi:MAG: RNB domain-containing ribonuclease, partial [Bacteroidetes bacterium]|nr:RNB domain-containing ribonuclease [Bacteroidota bacterium]
MTPSIRTRILTLLEKEKGRAFKTKELARQLDLPKQGEEYQRLKNLLRELQEQELLVRLKGSRWMLRHTEAVEQPADSRHVVGTLKQIRTLLYVEADDRDIEGDIAIGKRNIGGAHDGDRVVVRLLPESHRHVGLEGEVIEVLGPGGRADVEMLALARHYGLSMEFPDDVTDEAHALPAEISGEDLAGRMDLRGEECFTIDPEDARDFDDAVSLTMDNAGNYRLGVHIADVSHYVREGSPLDREALRRGTSVYLVDGVFPMLPERLSNHLCSLKEGKDRLTFSVIMIVTSRGTVKEFDMGKSVIHSRKRFSYGEVQNILEGGEGPHADTLGRMEKLAS